MSAAPRPRPPPPTSPLSLGPLGPAAVVAAILLSLGILALLNGRTRAALWLLGLGVLAIAVAGWLGWRMMRADAAARPRDPLFR